MPFLPLGCSCPLQTIVLSDLVGCDSPLQIDNLLGHHYCQQRDVRPNSKESLNSNKQGAKLPLLSAEGCHTRLDGQHFPQGVYSRVEKPSNDINSCLVLMNTKGLNKHINRQAMIVDKNTVSQILKPCLHHISILKIYMGTVLYCVFC